MLSFSQRARAVSSETRALFRRVPSLREVATDDGAGCSAHLVALEVIEERGDRGVERRWRRAVEVLRGGYEETNGAQNAHYESAKLILHADPTDSPKSAR